MYHSEANVQFVYCINWRTNEIMFHIYYSLVINNSLSFPLDVGSELLGVITITAATVLQVLLLRENYSK